MAGGNTVWIMCHIARCNADPTGLPCNPAQITALMNQRWVCWSSGDGIHLGSAVLCWSAQLSPVVSAMRCLKHCIML